MVRIFVLIIAAIATIATTVDFSFLTHGKAPTAEEIRLAFDRGISGTPDGQIQTVITQLDPARCISQNSNIYSGGIFRCRVRLETSLSTGERHASDASLVLAPFAREWTIVGLSEVTH